MNEYWLLFVVYFKLFVEKLEISGFKSFAKKTILDFIGKKNSKNGVTCIVGPNGSGKSNVSDALRWVIGEKSAKNLRGNKKEDVIFAGSSTKARLGCAQVSVFFDNSEKRFDIDYDEVIVTRKVYRDGENSYLINGSKVRLLDLINLLSKAGIGYGNYTIVNQGMTDQILLASPVERMGFLEDAAGVKEFQIKKNTSIARMKKTERNIEKAESQMREILPELKVLKTQAKKIEKSQQFRDELAEKRKEYFAVQLNGIENLTKKNILELEKINGQVSISEELVKKLKLDLKDTDDESIKKREIDIQKQETKKREIENKRYEFERLGFKKEIELKSLQEKIEQLDKEEIITVDRIYILSKLESLRDELAALVGKPLESGLVGRIKSLLVEIQAGKAVKKKAGKEIEAKKKVLKSELAEIKKQSELNSLEIENCQKEIDQINQAIRQINEENRRKQESRVELQDKLRREEFEIEKANKYKQHLELEKSKLDLEMKNILRNIEDSFVGKIDELRKISSSKKLDELKMEIEKLNWQLEQVKEIDPAVVGEYKEMQEKYDFLKTETKDLHLTLKELKEIITEMDKTIKKKMKEAFVAIDKEFSVYFKMMFGGGVAKLERIKIEKRKPVNEGGEELEDDDEPESLSRRDFGETDEYGLEIKVNPPGKKITNLNMLSGGERTLTSISLLFALISFNPPPFAFLDEIEANLDEANAERFSKILKKLSHKTQFILATHSREVMRTADILYGITMEKKEGFSKVFSVELTQVENNGKIKG